MTGQKMNETVTTQSRAESVEEQVPDVNLQHRVSVDSEEDNQQKYYPPKKVVRRIKTAARKESRDRIVASEEDDHTV